jgi:hypothetical protein
MRPRSQVSTVPSTPTLIEPQALERRLSAIGVGAQPLVVVVGAKKFLQGSAHPANPPIVGRLVRCTWL